MSRHAPLSPDDITRLLDAASGELRDFIETAYATGGRVSEVCGLTWADVDLEAGTVRLQGKGGDQRLVPLGVPAVKALRARRNGDERVFTLTADQVRVGLRRLGRRLGLTVSPHDLRHAFSAHVLTNAEKQGLQGIPAVAAMLGHVRWETTVNVYWRDGEADMSRKARCVNMHLPRAKRALMAHPDRWVDEFPYREGP